MAFIADEKKGAERVPYYEDATAEDGWQGQATKKDIKTLQSEITQAVSRLGGMITEFITGYFDTQEGRRDGYQISYFIKAADGRHVSGRIDIAALPINPNINWNRADKEKHRQGSKKMALYNVRLALDSMRLLQKLSPGYAALVPFMLGAGTDKTISELWAESPVMKPLLPPSNGDNFVEGEYKEL